jgi:hypothetical protein
MNDDKSSAPETQAKAPSDDSRKPPENKPESIWRRFATGATTGLTSALVKWVLDHMFGHAPSHE